MCAIPRRNIDELMFLYEIEPTIKDVFVEGPFDASIINWYIHEKKLLGVSAYTIDTIDIEQSLVLQDGESSNNKGRLLYLAKYYFERCTNDLGQLTCIVDLDFCGLLNKKVDIASLLYTDYSCMESYFLSVEIMQKFFIIICNRTNWPVSTILTTFNNILKTLFIIKLVNVALGLNLVPLKRLACISLEDWEITFDSDDYIIRYLNKNNMLKKLPEFKKCIKDYNKKLVKDNKYYVNGHDFIILLSWYLHQKGVRSRIVNEHNISRILASSLTIEYCDQNKMFKRLLRRLNMN